MASYPVFTSMLGLASIASQVELGSRPVAPDVMWAMLRLPTDPVGTTTLTLTNVVAGSRYRIERQGDGSLAEPTANAEGVAGSSTVPLTLNYYSAGNSNNALRIKVRKGSDVPAYKPFETQTTVGAASQSIYVGQIADE